jgi:hypothetical protein
LGCLVFAGMVLIWYLIYRYIGHTPLVPGYCENFGCNFPDDYKRNWFGDIWIYSPIWIPVLYFVFLWIRKNSKVIKVRLAANRLKILISILSIAVLVTLYIVIAPTIKQKMKLENTYQTATSKLEEKDYMAAIRGFEEIKNYKDSSKRIIKAKTDLKKEAEIAFKKGGYYKVVDILEFLHDDSQKGKELLSKAQEKIEAQKSVEAAKLAATAPYDGMSESDIPLSSWGTPTEIEYSQNYEATREDYRFKWYKWIIKDGYGRIVEIRSLIVQEGHVKGEPNISHYYVNQ